MELPQSVGVYTVGPSSMIQQQWDVNDHFTISNYRSAKTLQLARRKQ